MVDNYRMSTQEYYSYIVHSLGLHSDSDISDDDCEITWYDAANAGEPCEPDSC